MSFKTISLRLEAYERLKRARRSPAESFSDVVLRARWDGEPLTGAELLTAVRERGPLYSADELERLDRAQREDRPPEDKWAKRQG
jgi:hypothetical protein